MSYGKAYLQSRTYPKPCKCKDNRWRIVVKNELVKCRNRKCGHERILKGA